MKKKGNVPVWVQERFKEICDMPIRSGKQKLKSELIDEFCKFGTFETAYFDQFRQVRKVQEESEEAERVKW